MNRVTSAPIGAGNRRGERVELIVHAMDHLKYRRSETLGTVQTDCEVAERAPMPRILARNVMRAECPPRHLLGQRQVWIAALVCCLFFLEDSPASRALDPSAPLSGYARQTWVMENGLPQNTVTALVQTQDGYLWVGTEAGLVRFDGNAFQDFDRNSDAAIPGNDICCLLEGPDGALWVGTSEGLARSGPTAHKQ